MRRNVFIWLSLFVITTLNGQNPVSNFAVQSDVCIDERLSLFNSSTNASDYLWDFCPSDLSGLGEINEVLSLDGTNNAFGLSLVYEEGLYYGFVTSRENNKLFRLDYGDSLINQSSTIKVNEITITGDGINSPYDIELVDQSGVWYGLVTNGNSSISVLEIGTDIFSNTVTSTQYSDLGLSLPRGLKVVQESSNWVGIVSNFSSEKLTVVNFGSDLSSITPTTHDHPIEGGTQLIGLDAYPIEGEWDIVVASFNGNLLYKVHFDDLLGTSSSVTEIDGAGLELNTPAEISILDQGDSLYVYVLNRNAGLSLLVYNNSLASNPERASLEGTGSSAGFSNMLAMDFVKTGIDWQGQAMNFGNGNLFSIEFTSNCKGVELSNADLTANEPANIKYSTPGTKEIALFAFHPNETQRWITGELVVTSSIAPPISFILDNSQCINNSNAFAASSTVSDLTYSWDFNSDEIIDSFDASPTYQFQNTGTFDVSLVVQATNGCSNNASMEVAIYPEPPIPDFEITNETICSNSELSFSNLSDESEYPEEILSYTWDFDGVGASSETNAAFTFSSGGTKQVSLRMAIPGCETFISKNIEVVDGPHVEFSYTNNCYGEPIQFSNMSTGDGIESYTWSFDDGTEDTNTNPTHLFQETGQFEVSLLSINVNGCENSYIQNIIVSDEPKVDFIFSNNLLENLPITFNGLDLTQDDDEIDTWKWDFNEGAFSTLQSPRHIFAAPGEYNVGLTISTAQGCSDNIIKVLEISETTFSSPSFASASEVCISENVELFNSSANASSFLWDFCPSDLSGLGEINEVLSLDGTNNAFGLSLVYEEGLYYGFVTSRENNKLFRLDYGDSLINQSSTIKVNEITITGDGINSPYDIELVDQSGVWYGLVTNGNSSISVLEIGTDIFSNTVTSTQYSDLGLSLPRGLKVVQESSNWVGIVSNFSSEKLTVVNFGSDLSSITPTTHDHPIEGGTQLIGLDAYPIEGEWDIVVASFNGNLLYKVHFDDLLGTSSSVTEIDGAGLELNTPAEISILDQGDSLYVYVLNRNAGLSLLVYNNSLASNPERASLEGTGSSADFSNMLAMDFVKTGIDWQGQAMNFGNGNLFSIEFTSNCKGVELSNADLTANEPANIKYSTPGTKEIALFAFHPNETQRWITGELVVTSSIAPPISFILDNSQCINNSNAFAASSTVSDLTYSWDFNSDEIIDSFDASPSYQFQNIGTFDVSLVVQATNGCSNNASMEVAIYPEPPIPDFEITNETICSNSELSFSNLSDDSAHPIELLSYTWDFDGVGASSETNAAFTFTSGGTKQVSLTMSIPGCETFVSKNIEVIAGPDVGFEFVNSCETSEVVFDNQTTGDAIISYNWNFGDGFEDTNENTSHIFQSDGDYDITLQSTNETGCINKLSKPITIYSLPNVSFSTDLGCENSGLKFTDESTAPNANISAWSWYFAGLGESNEQNPTFNFQEAGSYEVELVAETNYGCVEKVIQEVTVLPSPVVDFEMNINCINELSVFSDLTSTLIENPITSWYWEIDDDVYTEQNPDHLFSTSGAHNVSLTVTTENGCAIQKTNEFILESLPVADFTVANTCDNEYTIFNDISTIESSVIVSRTWSIDGIESLNGQRAVYNFSQAGVYEVTLTVLNEIGCTNSITKTVEIFKAPEADFETDVDFGAPPLQVNFQNNSVDATSFAWLFDDNANSESSDPSPGFTFNEVKDYNVRLVANNDFGCTDTTYAKVVSTIPELDLELISVTPSLNNGVINLSISMVNSGTVRIDGLNVVVSLENEFKIIEKYKGTLNANQEETYTLNFDIPASNSNIGYVCVRLDDYINDIADLNTNNNEQCINIDEIVVIENPFPNPCEDELALKIILPSSSSINLHLLNIHGKTVYSQSYFDLPSGLNSFLLDLQNFEKGMYFLKIQTSQVEEVKRILKF